MKGFLLPCYIDRINRDYWEVIYNKLSHNPYDAILKNKRTGEVIHIFIEYIDDEFDEPPRLWKLLRNEK